MTHWAPPASSHEVTGQVWGESDEGRDVSEADWPVEGTEGQSLGSGWTEGIWEQVLDGSQWQEGHSGEEEVEMEGTEDEAAAAAQGPSFSAAQVTSDEYLQQSKAYTRLAVEQLMASPEYKIKTTRCQTCWKVWYLGECSPGCHECGGFAMERPCAICLGKCGALWQRDVYMSHSHHEAHWTGDCQLPPEERDGFLAQRLLEGSEGGEKAHDELLEALSDLQTG